MDTKKIFQNGTITEIVKDVPVENRPKKYFGKFKKPLTSLPDLVLPQIKSFEWLLKHGLEEVFKEFSSIKDYAGKKFELDFTGFKLSEAKYDEYYAKSNKLSYEAPLKVTVRLKNKVLNSVKEQELFIADFPLMTNHGTFIISGIERVIVPQLARSFGISFLSEESKGKRYFGAKIIPSRGAWIEIESDADGAIYVRIDRKRKFAASSLLRILGAKTDDAIFAAFKDNTFAKAVLEATLAKDHAKTPEESYLEIHKRLRDGDLGTVDNAREFINSIFNPERYDISKVGRFRFNKRFGKSLDAKAVAVRTITLDDLVTDRKSVV